MNKEGIFFHQMPGETAIINLVEEIPVEIPGHPGESDGKVDHKRIAYAVVTTGIIKPKVDLSLPGSINNVKTVYRIHHIWTDPKRRREGKAKAIIQAIQKHSKTSEIYAEGYTKEGVQLLESCGFEKNEGMYEWKK